MQQQGYSYLQQYFHVLEDIGLAGQELLNTRKPTAAMRIRLVHAAKSNELVLAIVEKFPCGRVETEQVLEVADQILDGNARRVAIVAQLQLAEEQNRIDALNTHPLLITGQGSSRREYTEADAVRSSITHSAGIGWIANMRNALFGNRDGKNIA